MSARASLAYFLTRGLSGALAFVTVSLFARLLGPQGYGSLTSAQTLSAFIGSVCILPIHTSLGRFLPGSTNPRLTSTLGRLLMAGSLIGFLVCGTLALGWPGDWPLGVAMAAGLLCLGQGMFDFAGQWSSARLMARRYSRLYFAKALLTPALGVGFIALGASAFHGVVMGLFASFLLATLACTPELWKDCATAGFSRDAVRNIWSYAPGVALYSLLNATLIWSDRIVIKAIVPQGLGVYAAANDITQQGFGLIFSALCLAWYPKLVAAWEHKSNEFPALSRRYAQVSISLLLPAAAGFTLVSSDLSHAILGQSFQNDAPRVMPWLTLASAVGGIRMYLTDIPLHLNKKMWTQSLIVGICGACLIGLNLALLPRYGILGAAWSAIAANTLGLAMSTAVALRCGGLHWPWRDAIGATVGIVLMAGTLHFLPHGNVERMVTRMVVGALVYGLVALAWDLAGTRGWLYQRWRQHKVGT